ncbi:hypothetical protein Sjap_008735 [Stephania japonica]|uniref:Reverse transcriptase domain-containing protein n=1 Tax=Stephania japonica TaxID=461633 RepID=A0AAP0JQ41_9MAGN
MAFMNEFHKTGVVCAKMNETYISLIPKGTHQGQVNNYRPISLITSPYKNLSKVLATRLRSVLERTIASEQNAFTPGRHMLDSVSIESETIEHIRVGIEVSNQIRFCQSLCLCGLELLRLCI